MSDFSQFFDADFGIDYGAGQSEMSLFDADVGDPLFDGAWAKKDEEFGALAPAPAPTPVPPQQPIQQPPQQPQNAPRTPAIPQQHTPQMQQRIPMTQGHQTPQPLQAHQPPPQQAQQGPPGPQIPQATHQQRRNRKPGRIQIPRQSMGTPQPPQQQVPPQAQQGHTPRQFQSPMTARPPLQQQIPTVGPNGAPGTVPSSGPNTGPNAPGQAGGPQFRNMPVPLRQGQSVSPPPMGIQNQQTYQQFMRQQQQQQQAQAQSHNQWRRASVGQATGRAENSHTPLMSPAQIQQQVQMPGAQGQVPQPAVRPGQPQPQPQQQQWNDRGAKLQPQQETIKLSLIALLCYMSALKALHAQEVQGLLAKLEHMHMEQVMGFFNQLIGKVPDIVPYSARIPPSEIPQEKFQRVVADFMQNRGTPVFSSPTVAGKRFNLYVIFMAVQSLGSFMGVIRGFRWQQLAQQLQIPFTSAIVRELIQTYVRLLLPYEEAFNSNAQVRTLLLDKNVMPAPTPAQIQAQQKARAAQQQAHQAQPQPPPPQQQQQQQQQPRTPHVGPVAGQQLPQAQAQHPAPGQLPLGGGRQHHQQQQIPSDRRQTPGQYPGRGPQGPPMGKVSGAPSQMPAQVPSNGPSLVLGGQHPGQAPGQVSGQTQKQHHRQTQQTSRQVPNPSSRDLKRAYAQADNGPNKVPCADGKEGSGTPGSPHNTKSRNNFELQCEDDQYLLQRRHLSTYGGHDMRNIIHLGSEIENWRPYVAFPLDLGTVDLHAITMSLASRYPADVRQALDKLVVVTADPRVHISLQHCPHLFANLSKAVEDVLNIILEDGPDNIRRVHSSIKTEPVGEKELSTIGERIFQEVRQRNHYNTQDLVIEVDSNTGAEANTSESHTGSVTLDREHIQQLKEDQARDTEQLKIKEKEFACKLDGKPCIEDMDTKLKRAKEMEKDIHKPFGFTSYTRRYALVEQEFSALNPPEDDKVIFYRTAACNRLLAGTCVIRNLSFAEANKPLIAKKPQFQKLLWKILYSLAENDCLLDSHLRTLDLSKDLLVCLSNISLHLVLDDPKNALILVLFLLSFSIQETPFHDDGEVEFVECDTEVHRYLSNAIDIFAKVIPRDRNNMNLIEGVLKDTITDPDYRILVKRLLGPRTKLHPCEFLTRMFAMVVAVLPYPHIKLSVDPRGQVIWQSSLGCEMLVDMIPSDDDQPDDAPTPWKGYNVAQKWLNSKDRFGVRALRTVKFMGMVVVPTPQGQHSGDDKGEKSRPFAPFTQRGVLILHKLYQMAMKSPTFSHVGIIPTIEQVLGGLFAIEMDKSVVRMLEHLYLQCQNKDQRFTPRLE